MSTLGVRGEIWNDLEVGGVDRLVWVGGDEADGAKHQLSYCQRKQKGMRTKYYNSEGYIHCSNN